MEFSSRRLQIPHFFKYALRLEIMKGTLGGFDGVFFRGRYPGGSRTRVAGIEIQLSTTFATLTPSTVLFWFGLEMSPDLTWPDPTLPYTFDPQ